MTRRRKVLKPIQHILNERKTLTQEEIYQEYIKQVANEEDIVGKIFFESFLKFLVNNERIVKKRSGTYPALYLLDTIENITDSKWTYLEETFRELNNQKQKKYKEDPFEYTEPTGEEITEKQRSAAEKINTMIDEHAARLIAQNFAIINKNISLQRSNKILINRNEQLFTHNLELESMNAQLNQVLFLKEQEIKDLIEENLKLKGKN